jgi:hypothetical protein
VKAHSPRWRTTEVWRSRLRTKTYGTVDALGTSSRWILTGRKGATGESMITMGIKPPIW